jgi:hypothetical protein
VWNYRSSNCCPRATRIPGRCSPTFPALPQPRRISQSNQPCLGANLCGKLIGRWEIQQLKDRVTCLVCGLSYKDTWQMFADVSSASSTPTDLSKLLYQSKPQTRQSGVNQPCLGANLCGKLIGRWEIQQLKDRVTCLSRRHH